MHAPTDPEELPGTMASRTDQLRPHHGALLEAGTSIYATTLQIEALDH